jgi:spermidine/putrescine transport system permease protein
VTARRGRLPRGHLGRAAALSPTTIWYALFFLLPLAWLVRVSFAVVDNFRLEYVWSTSTYAQLWHDPLTWRLLERSFANSLGVTALTLLVGYPAAWLLAQQPPRRRNLLLLLMIVPWWSSYIVRIFAWRMAFGDKGVINEFLTWTGVSGPLNIFGFGWVGVVVAELNLYLPLMIVPLYMTLERLDRDVIRASSALGASPLRTFFRVVLPLSAPGIATGIIFVLMPMTGEFVVPSLVGAPTNFLYGNQIQTQFGTSYDWPYGSALAAVLLLLLALVLVVVRVVAGRVTRNLRPA